MCACVLLRRLTCHVSVVVSPQFPRVGLVSSLHLAQLACERPPVALQLFLALAVPVLGHLEGHNSIRLGIGALCLVLEEQMLHSLFQNGNLAIVPLLHILQNAKATQEC